MASVVAVVFDVGETLIDETQAWGGWADFSACDSADAVHTRRGRCPVGGVTTADALRMRGPGIDVDAETRARTRAHGFRMMLMTCTPNAMPCLRALAAAGICHRHRRKPTGQHRYAAARDGRPVRLLPDMGRLQKPLALHFLQGLQLSAAVVHVRPITRQRCGRRCCGPHESRIPPSRTLSTHSLGAAGTARLCAG